MTKKNKLGLEVTYNLDVIVRALTNIIQRMNLAVISFVASLSLGCSSVGYFERDDSPEDHKVVSGREAYPWAVMNITRSDVLMIGYMGWNGGPVSLLLWAPYFAIDLPISLCVDTVTMPWQIYRYSNFPDQKDAEGESPQIFQRESEGAR